jgi:hypothetical protein
MIAMSSLLVRHGSGHQRPDFSDGGQGIGDTWKRARYSPSVMVALEAAGVELLNHGQPGVRLKQNESSVCRILARSLTAPIAQSRLHSVRRRSQACNDGD